MDKVKIILRILVLLSPFFAPWWISLIFVCASLFYFDKYYDVILMGFFFDILYHSANTSFGLYGFTLISCALFVIVKQIKQRLILY